MKIITNNTPRFTIDAFDLSEKERKEFDYLNWEAIDKGEDSATFFRYKGQLYDLGEFMQVTDTMENCHGFEGWHGHMSDSFFSGILIKYTSCYGEQVIVGQYFS